MHLGWLARMMSSDLGLKRASTMFGMIDVNSSGSQQPLYWQSCNLEHSVSKWRVGKVSTTSSLGDAGLGGAIADGVP